MRQLSLRIPGHGGNLEIDKIAATARGAVMVVGEYDGDLAVNSIHTPVKLLE